MIELVVVFCLVHNPYLCRTLEMVPDDGHKIASQMECIKGGAIGGMTFTLENMQWRTRGWRCRQRPNIVQAWRHDRGTAP